MFVRAYICVDTSLYLGDACLNSWVLLLLTASPAPMIISEGMLIPREQKPPPPPAAGSVSAPFPPSPPQGDHACSYNQHKCSVIKYVPRLHRCIYVYWYQVRTYSVYDKDWKFSRHSFSFVNSVNFPLIMYGKYVRPNLIWPDKWSIWLENVLWLAIIISPDLISSCKNNKVNLYSLAVVIMSL